MTTFRQPWLKKTLSSTTVMLGLFAVLIFILSVVFGNLTKKRAVDEQARKLSQEIDDLEKQNADLEKILGYFASSDYTEKEAREKLNFAKPGEKVAIISGGEENKNLTSKPGDGNEKQLGASFKKWWQYFFGQ